MAYIRTKTIDGQQYHYLVQSIRNGKKVSQKFIAYLGKHKSVQAAHRFWSHEARSAGDPKRRKEAHEMMKRLEPHL